MCNSITLCLPPSSLTPSFVVAAPFLRAMPRIAASSLLRFGAHAVVTSLAGAAAARAWLVALATLLGMLTAGCLALRPPAPMNASAATLSRSAARSTPASAKVQHLSELQRVGVTEGAASLHEFARVNRRMHNKLLIAEANWAVTAGRNIAMPTSIERRWRAELMDSASALKHRAPTRYPPTAGSSSSRATEPAARGQRSSRLVAFTLR